MELNINNKTYSVDVEPTASLLTVLRDYLDLTGAKYGCGEGACGACTVLVDGQPARSCITPISSLIHKRITTIEGLTSDGKLHPVQQAFIDNDAFQCAYCASGMVMTAVALLERYSSPTDEQIRNFMNGNICRCGTYPRIVRAIKSVKTT
ncbi:MAG TPA: (2Fe-2S)-binding protein [Cyclobacteriaceae bacterium]|jgi:aerobic-type carbon monoxide dehydrogenase small subunit (CoxS/CutS family)